jgi:phosphatidate cytidylyltransferase
VASLPLEPALPAASRRELGTRIASAAILAPVALAAVLIGGTLFAAVVAAVAVTGFWEWTGIAKADRPPLLRLGGAAALAAGLLGLVLSLWAGALIAVVAGAFALAGRASRALLWMALGIAYVGLPCFALIVLRQTESGLLTVLLILFIVWATDIGAFFGGRRFGGPRLAPRISPGKTWSGAVSGLAAAAIAGAATLWLARTGSAAAGALIALPLSVAAQCGDLLESAVKRRFAVKDSSRLIPGHGGILDRVDGLFGAAALGLVIAALGLGGALLAPAGFAFPAPRP